MAEKKPKKKKEKTHVVLPKAWQSVKHRDQTAQVRTTYDDTWSAVGTIALVLLVLFVLLGGVSQTGFLKVCFNWAHNVGEGISNWLEGGSIVTNEDGIYWDPTGQTGEKIGDENGEVPNVTDELFDSSENGDAAEPSEGNAEPGNSEVKTE